MSILAIGLFEYRKFIGNKNREFESVKSIILDVKSNLFYCENYLLHITSGYYHIGNKNRFILI